MLSCYNVRNADTMSDARMSVWASKTGRSMVSIPKLESLPPTNEAFEMNVRRAHLQAWIWKNPTVDIPQIEDYQKFGWRAIEATKTLSPILLPSRVDMAPKSVLEFVKCN